MPPKPAPTHFLCIPLVTPVSRPQLAQNLAAFAADVTSPASFGVPQDAVRPVGTLHLTLGVLSFPKNEGLDKALKLLRSLRPREMLADVAALRMPGTEGEAPSPVAGDEKSAPAEPPLRITLRGLASIQPAAQASVLYVPPVDPLGTLQAFCEKLRAAFLEAELMAAEDRPLLLHATVLNTIYVKGRDRDRDGQGAKQKKGGGRRWDRLTIDARGIVDRYDEQVWTEDVPVEKIAICRMGAKKTLVGDVEDEAYEVEAEIVV